MKRLGRIFGPWKFVSWRSALLAAVIVYGLVGFLLVPVVVKTLVVDTIRERTGREAAVEDVRCNPFTMSLTVRGFSIPDRPGSTLLAFDELHVNAQISSLFRWALTLKEFRVENPYLGLRRFDDGGINVLELMDDIEARTPPDDNPSEDGGLPRALLRHILVRGSTIDLEDFDREEPLSMSFGPSRYELHDISTIPDKAGDNEFAIGLVEGGTITVTGDVVVEPLGLNGTVAVDALFLEYAWPLLKPYFEFDLVGGNAAGRFVYSVKVEDTGLQATISDFDYRVENLELKIRDHDINLLEVPLLTISSGSLVWPDARVGAAAVAVDGADVYLWLEPDGTPNWAGLVPEETQTQVVTTYRQVEEAFPWKIDVGRFEITKSSAHFEDRTFDEPVRMMIENAGVALTDIVTGPGHQWGLTASALLLGEATATANGFVGTGPMRLETEIGVEDLDIGRFQPYLERTAPLELRAGRLSSTGSAVIDPGGEGPVATFVGDLDILEIDLRETVVGSRVLRWGRVESRGIDASVQPTALEIGSIDIQGAGIEVVVSDDGRVNLIELMAELAERSRAAGGGAAAELPPIKVNAVTLRGCSTAYTDRTLTPPFTLALDPVDGTVRGISSESAAGADLDIDGAVRSGGMMDLSGEMDLLDPKRLTDLTIDLRQVGLPPVSPMAVRYIGHPFDEGAIDIGLKYEITNSELIGSNRFVTDGLVLGDKVEGEGMVNLPFKLGVSLLTDKEGLMTIEFPIEGNLDDPGFGIGNAIGSAAKEIVGELVKSPFRLLGKLGGGAGDEDLGYVEFEAGSAELNITAVEKLRTLAAGADQRPELGFQVAGGFEPGVDSAALREAAFAAVVAQRQSNDVAESGGPPTLELLEALYRETASEAELDQLRSHHLTESPEGGEAGGEEVLDETAYYRELKSVLIAAQSIDSSGLQDLGSARAESIRSFLVDAAGLDGARVAVGEPMEIEATGDAWVRCRLEVSAGD